MTLERIDPGCIALADSNGMAVALSTHAPENDPQAEADYKRLRDTWNAALGLELPEGVPPGILKDLLTVATEALPLMEGRVAIDDALVTGAICGSATATKVSSLQAAAELSRLKAEFARRTLAALNPTPVSYPDGCAPYGSPEYNAALEQAETPKDL